MIFQKLKSALSNRYLHNFMTAYAIAQVVMPSPDWTAGWAPWEVFARQLFFYVFSVYGVIVILKRNGVKA